ncbi:hypothetical protein ACI2KX_06570 [Ectopseudomonas khazarica]|uniref:hypothetical protein n=1 Tax=Ectopseudomonas khazarica TaxID=2502979 RepID=UPI00384A5A89
MRPLRATASILPWAILAGYIFIISGFYGTYLDAGLTFIPPASKGSREDILGFGPEIRWTIFLLTWATAYFSTFRLRRALGNLVLLIVTGGVAATDYFLYRVLEAQIPL